MSAHVCQPRGEIYAGPDERRRYHYALFWCADYHPGHPDGEYRHAERGQHFFSEITPTRDRAYIWTDKR